MRERAGEIAALIPEGAALIEFGSGSSMKTRTLLGAARELAAYVPVDISAEFLDAQAESLRREYPTIAMLPVAADFGASFDLPVRPRTCRVRAFFRDRPSEISSRTKRRRFCARPEKFLAPDGVFVVGVDLIKDENVLNDAYNDSAGVTAAFNRNLLVRINRELGANFDLASFEHHAFFNRELRRIEMHLASLRRQRVQVCGVNIEFRAGETIHTESSYKYTVETFQCLARGVGWTPLTVWTDAKKYFSVHVLKFKSEAVRRPQN